MLMLSLSLLLSSIQENPKDSVQIKVDSEESMLSRRSQQFNEAFQRYGMHSDEDILYQYYKKKGVNLSDQPSTNYMVREIISDVVNRAHQEAIAPMSVMRHPSISSVQWGYMVPPSGDQFSFDQFDELSGENGSEQNADDDEFDKLIESTSSSKFSKSI